MILECEQQELSFKKQQLNLRNIITTYQTTQVILEKPWISITGGN